MHLSPDTDQSSYPPTAKRNAQPFKNVSKASVKQWICKRRGCVLWLSASPQLGKQSPSCLGGFEAKVKLLAADYAVEFLGLSSLEIISSG